jgi:hypothetical protein
MSNGNVVNGILDLMKYIKDNVEPNLPAEYKGRIVPFLW